MLDPIIFISDDAPLKTKGSGISVLLFNILSALQEYNISVITFCNKGISPTEIITESPTNSIIVCDQRVIGLYDIFFIKYFSSVIKFIAFIFSKKKSLLHKKNVKPIVITMVGARFSPLWKFIWIHLFFPNVKNCLYIVDDLELINKKLNSKVQNILIRFLLPYCIKKSFLLFTITQGLKDNYSKRYNKDSIVLFPTFEKRSTLYSSGSTKNYFKFLFTGGLSFLYLETLTKFASTIQLANKVTSRKIILVIQTYTEKSYFDKYFGNFEFVEYSTVERRDELVAVYRDINCFLVPYSFNLYDKNIVASSFPQKLAEIIQYGKDILVIGPPYSSTIDFFNRNNLRHVCVDDNTDALLTVITTISESNEKVNVEAYINAYEEYLSAASIQKKFNSSFEKDITL